VTYSAPLAAISSALKHGTGLVAAIEQGLFGELGMEDIDAIVAEAGRFAGEVIAPLNRIGDIYGASFKDGIVATAPGWKEAYRAWRLAGWNAVTAPAEWGGQALPQIVNAACTEMWQAASMGFANGPMLTMAAIDALSAHGSDALKRTYLEKLVSGEWMGTMQLTEPQAGSDVGALRTRAERAVDGSYRIKGQKIFITYGEHDFTENIIHFVLARLPDGPPGTRGISLFLVPKFLLKADGSLGARNDVRAHSVEHKLGIHGSPTCTMIFGDGGGATGFLIGEENAGMACMFTMMNRARLAVGLQGVGVAECATQQALAYARERRQGRTAGVSASQSVPIIVHPDVRRMLLTMRALTQAARAICYATALAIDRSERSNGDAGRSEANRHASLLTPVAKAFSTDVSNEVTSLGIQVHGGMGYIEETGASHLGELRGVVHALDASNDPGFGWTAVRLGDAVESLARTTNWLLARLPKEPDAALAGASPYLRLFGLATGGCLLAKETLTAMRLGKDAAARLALTRFFAENIAVGAGALERTVVEGAAGIVGGDAALAAS